MRKVLAALAIALAAFASVFVMQSPSFAIADDCKPDVTVHLPARPDNGHHGVWATLTIDRTVRICVEHLEMDGDTVTSTFYLATITDTGTLTTLDSQSPRDGVDLAAGITGTVEGTATQPFWADGAAWTGYTEASPAVDTSTGNWVQTVYGADIHTDGLQDYTWTYKTCSEKWVDSSSNSDGTSESAGDITGQACPTPTATPTPPAATPTPTPVGATSTATTPAAHNAAETLPVTGSRTLLISSGGVILLSVGVLLVVLVSKRRRA